MRPKLFEYEVNVNHWNVLSKQYDSRYEFVKATSQEEALKQIRWMYGTTIDIISIKLT